VAGVGVGIESVSGMSLTGRQSLKETSVIVLKLSCSAGACWLEVTEDAGAESPFVFKSLPRSYELRLLPMLRSFLNLTFRSVTEILQKSFCMLASCSL
jgi:hypothetical protein